MSNLFTRHGLLQLNYNSKFFEVSNFRVHQQLSDHYLYGRADPWSLTAASGGHMGLCNGWSYFLHPDTCARPELKGSPRTPYLRLTDYFHQL